MAGAHTAQASGWNRSHDKKCDMCEVQSKADARSFKGFGGAAPLRRPAAFFINQFLRLVSVSPNRRMPSRKKDTCDGARASCWFTTSRTEAASRKCCHLRTCWTKSKSPKTSLWSWWATKQTWTTPGKSARRKVKSWPRNLRVLFTSALLARERATLWRLSTSSAGRWGAGKWSRARLGGEAPPPTSSRPSIRCLPKSAAKKELS